MRSFSGNVLPGMEYLAIREGAASSRRGMADIFLSYAREDLNFAEKLAKALEARGWSVWWDRRIAAGDRFNEVITGQLKDARLLVTVWSRQSVGSRWVHDEAEYALEQKKIVPVLADDVDIPLGLRGVHAADLRGWKGSSQHPGFRRLVRDISERLGPAPQPEPEGVVSIGRYRIGRDIVVKVGEKVHFTVYHPKEIKPEVWCTLLAYMHLLKMQSTVEADAKQRLDVPHGRRFGESTYDIMRGAEIVVAPELPGCRFNPTSARLLWLEDWHRIEFRLQAQPELAGFELGKAVNGRVAFYVESVLVGEVPIWTCISDEADTTAADAPTSTASAESYEAIFVSYAHEDSSVVSRLGRAYKALGMEFLRDVEKLRSGEQWNPALLTMIERANIFQLYWSRAAKRSRYVKQEWSHALKQERSHFIRPLYWQLPMPQPPRQLAQLNFSYIELDN